MKIGATNVVASRPPERQPTATPTASANIYGLAMSTLDYGLAINSSVSTSYYGLVIFT